MRYQQPLDGAGAPFAVYGGLQVWFSLGHRPRRSRSSGRGDVRRVPSAQVVADRTGGSWQLAVIDPSNLAQTILIAERMSRHLEELRRQFETIRRMGEGLGNMEGYRIPTIGITYHDPSRWEYGRRWIEGLNSGDATGAGYWSTTIPLQRLSAWIA